MFGDSRNVRSALDDGIPGAIVDSRSSSINCEGGSLIQAGSVLFAPDCHAGCDVFCSAVSRRCVSSLEPASSAPRRCANRCARSLLIQPAWRPRNSSGWRSNEASSAAHGRLSSLASRHSRSNQRCVAILVKCVWTARCDSCSTCRIGRRRLCREFLISNAGSRRFGWRRRGIRAGSTAR